MLPYWVFSFLPGLEIRAAIPMAILQGQDLVFAFCISYLLNLLVIPIIFTILTFFSPYLSRLPLWQKYLKRLRTKAKKWEDAGLLGLLIFVAIPLPGSGVYSGSVLAWLLGLKNSKAAGVMAIGCFLAGVIVTLPFLTLHNYI